MCCYLFLLCNPNFSFLLLCFTTYLQYYNNLFYKYFSAITYSWEGGSKLGQNLSDFASRCVTREDYEEHGHNICAETFDI
jgi:hypothetical protein